MGNRSGRRVLYGAIVLVLLAAGTAALRSTRQPSGDAAPAGAEGARGPARLSATSTPDDPSAGQPPGTIEGIVLDPDGQPVDGAHVAVTRSWRRDQAPATTPWSAVRGFATTAGGGRFRIQDLPPDEYGANAVAAGWLPGYSAPLKLQPGAVARVEIRLAAGGISLSGRVLDAGGGTVPGAKLVISPSGGGGDPEGPPRTLQSTADGEGAFRLNLPRGSHSVSVEATGYAPSREQLTLNRSTVRDFRLAPGARISGRVVERGSRAPVADAEVTLRPGERISGPFMRRAAKTDSAGTFTLSELEGGSFQLNARKGALAGTTTQIFTVGLAQVVNDVEIEVSPALTVSGRVLVKGEGRGVAGARVSLLSQDGPGGGPFNTNSSGDGSYALEGVLPGRYSISVEADGFGRAGQMLQLAAGDMKQDIELTPGVVVLGEVLDGAGKPVAGARVSASVEGHGAGFNRSNDFAVTKDDGRFELKRLGAGELRLTASLDKGGVVGHGPEAVAAGQRKQLTLRLARGGFVSGTVRFPDKTPAADVRLGAMHREYRSQPAYATTEADGTYRLGPFPKGTVVVSADRRGQVSWRSGSDPPNQQTLALGENEDKAGVDLIVEPGGHSISGALVGPDGRPVGLATIVAGLESNGRASRGFRAEKTFTAHDGQFTLTDLQAGLFTLWAVHPDYPDAELKGVAAGSKSVKLQLPRDTSVAGAVTDQEGKPVAAFSVVAVPGPAAGETPEQRRRRQMDVFEKPTVRVHDPGGVFRLRRLTPGNYELMVAAADGRAGSAVVMVEAGEQRTAVKIALATGLRVTGRVLELQGGAPIVGAEVRAFGPGNARVQATTGPDGAFALENAPADTKVRLSISGDHRTYVPESKEVDVPPNAAAVDAGTVKLMRGDLREKMQSPKRGSVGCYIAMEKGVPRVRGVQKDSAAEKAGILKGDRVVSVAGTPVGEMGSGAINYLLEGDAGTTVEITVETAGAASRTVTLTRDQAT